MPGILEVVGSATVSGRVVADTVAGLSVSDLASLYSYKDATGTHQVILQSR